MSVQPCGRGGLFVVGNVVFANATASFSQCDWTFCLARWRCANEIRSKHWDISVVEWNASENEELDKIGRIDIRLALDWRRESFFSPNSVVTLGVLTVVKKPGWLEGGGRVAHRFHRYFRGFVLACSFRLWIFVVFGWRRPTPAAFVCKFS